jgi:flagellum-specific peptidoglycan hydrolase FlgJ
MDREQRLMEIARSAVALETETGCPAPLMIAQWALESDWGAKPACHANFFGMKREARHAKGCVVTTTEFVNGQWITQDLQFAEYDSLEDSCRDYAWLITRGEPYRAAWERYQKDHDLHALITAVASKYASDPAYARLVTEIADQMKVEQSLGTSRQEETHLA